MALKPEEIAYTRKVGERKVNISKAAAERQKEAQQKWKREKTVALSIRLSLAADADVIEKLNSVKEKSAYVKALIRADIEREEND